MKWRVIVRALEKWEGLKMLIGRAVVVVNEEAVRTARVQLCMRICRGNPTVLGAAVEIVFVCVGP